MISGGGRLAGIGGACMYSLADSTNFSELSCPYPAIYYCQRPVVSSRLRKEEVLILPILETNFYALSQLCFFIQSSKYIGLTPNIL